MTEAVEPGSGRGAGTLRIERPAAPGGIDFERAVVCILGLPFDAVTLPQAVQQIRASAFAGRRCFVSTPNLHFAIAARSDPAFRNTVLRSDLSLVDGMPLVWIARLLGLPVPERVAGADVFEALQAHAGPQINVYLFGGPPGAGAEACERINRRGGGVRCVGHDPAGFGSIESMSSDEQIERINRSGAHFVVASLGAKKGQAWLDHNAARLTAPVLSHLGAVLNFAAGTIRRAPRWMRWWGMEWLWRIKEEPELWRRYWHDGLVGMRMLVSRVLPDVLMSRVSSGRTGAAAAIDQSTDAGGTVLRLRGLWCDSDCRLLRPVLTRLARDPAALTLDLSAMDGAGGAFVALMLLARGWFGDAPRLRIVGARPAVVSMFRRKLAEHLLAATAHA